MDSQQTCQAIQNKLASRKWRLNNLYYIKDKAGHKILLKLNWAQSNLYKGLWYFNVILKARQLGFTTFIMIYFLDCCLFNSNQAAGVIAHTKDDAQDLFDNKVKFAYDNLPEWLKEQRSAQTDTAKKLVFNNGSSFTVGTSLRSGTYQKLLISEYGKISAKYPEKAREIKTGALNTVEAGQQIFIESTAEGKSGEFFDMVQDARHLFDQGKDLTRLESKFHFYAWYRNPEYRMTDEETARTVITQEMAAYLDNLPLNANQKAWYAAKAKTMKDDMKREYPSTPDEAFEGSLEGAFYTKEMAIVRASGGIWHVPYDRKYPVSTFWDIGQARDQMSIWFYQFINGRHRFINYHESNGEGWDYYAKILKDMDYNYKIHEWPHDGNKRIVGREVYTSRQLAEQVGIKPIHITPVTKSVYDDIRNYCRPILPDCEFDESKCSLGITRLDNYRRKWDDTNSMWMNDAQHDEASHGADAFRTFAVSVDKNTTKPKQKPQGQQRTRTLGWMGA
jgi:hypothetical protein